MRELTDHKLNQANNDLKIHVVDDPGAGGANHRYLITGFRTDTNPSWDGPQHHAAQNILFQNGTIPEVGVNGVTQEALLAIVIDRLRSFQAGPFANKYNASALEHCELALGSLLDRTRDRLARGVEGKHAA